MSQANAQVGEIAQGDRREAHRTTALFRPALITVGDLCSFCLVRNISSSGMMASIYARLQIGQRTKIRFDENRIIEGTIVWVANDRTGVKFDKAIDVGALLAELSGPQSSGKHYRSPRLEIQAKGQFFDGSGVHSIQVRDISQRGMKAEAKHLVEGDKGTLALPGLTPKAAVARWIKDDIVGFYFVDPIGFSELGQWVLSHHDWNIENDAVSIYDLG